jgi:hypothetical protein
MNLSAYGARRDTTMNQKKLSAVIYKMAHEIYEREVDRLGNITQETADVTELLKVLSRILEGKTVAKSFGAPGDWGYGTPIGDALAARSEALPAGAVE